MNLRVFMLCGSFWRRRYGIFGAAPQAGGSDRPSRRLGVTGGPPGDEDATVGWSCRSPVRFTSSGSGIRTSSTPQPNTAQMTSLPRLATSTPNRYVPPITDSRQYQVT